MGCQQNLDPLISAEAARRGVPAEIALKVAQIESGRCQWDKKGNVKRGKASEVGAFQVMPSSAPGVNLFDVQQNIAAGVGYLAEMYRQFGTWPLAIAAYNCGPDCARKTLAGKRTFPAGTIAYVNVIFGPGALDRARPGAPVVAAAPSPPAGTMPASPDLSPLLVAGSAAGIALLVLWWYR
jgi:hypothetical protein